MRKFIFVLLTFRIVDTAFGQPFFLCDERYYLATTKP